MKASKLKLKRRWTVEYGHRPGGSGPLVLVRIVNGKVVLS